MLVCSTRVFQAEGHDLIAVNAIGCDEGYLFFVLFLEFYLVVTKISVQEGKACAARRGVDDLIDSRQWEGILRTIFIECSVINTYMKYICVLLGDQYWIGNPSQLFDLFDESSVL
jgi:hypothetical protein